MTTDFHEMNLREQLTLNAALQAQIDHLAAALADERRHADALAEALGQIEAGLPAGSSLTDEKHPLWRSAYRDLQRIARLALHPHRARRQG